MERKAPSTRERRLAIRVGSCLVLATLLLYWPTVGYQFIIADDYQYVCWNSHVMNGLSWLGVKWAFGSMYASNWHPLTWLSHMLDCSIYGLYPGGHHLTNVIFHAANTVLLFSLLKRLTGALWPSALAAGLFALHPLHVESVAWICERKDVLSTFFLLLTIDAYARYAERPARLKYYLALLLFSFGLMSKPMLVTTPFLLLLLDYWPLNRFEPTPQTSTRARQWQKLVVEKVPFLVLSLLGCIMTFAAQSASGTVSSLKGTPFILRATNAINAYASYLGKAIWPTNLSVFYPFQTSPHWGLCLASTVLLLACTWIAFRWRSRFPWLITGWLWFLGSLVPVIGLVRVGDQSMADRYTYIPYIGLFIILAWSANSLSNRPRVLRVVCPISVALLLGYGLAARIQLHYWHDNLELFSRAEMLAPANCGFAGIDLSYTLAHRGVDAVPRYEAILRTKSKSAARVYRDGSIAPALGNLDEAFAELSECLNYDSRSDSLHNNAGIVLSEQDRPDEAIDEFQKAIGMNPKSPWAYFNCATVLQKSGKAGEALTDFTKAVELRPAWPEALDKFAFLLAVCPDSQGHDAPRAVRLALQANQLTGSTSPNYLRTLAVAYAATGGFSNAAVTAELALKKAQSGGFRNLAANLQKELSSYHAAKIAVTDWRSPPTYAILSQENEVLPP